MTDVRRRVVAGLFVAAGAVVAPGAGTAEAVEPGSGVSYSAVGGYHPDSVPCSGGCR